MAKSYFVKAIWDSEANVWISETDIPGLNIEADSLEEFERLMKDLGPELLAANTDLRNQTISVDFSVTERLELAVA
jgi:hypothetical protein